MSQQVNLLNPALIKKKDFFSPNNLLIILGLLSTFMLAYYSYAKIQVSSLTAQRNQTAEELSALQAQLDQATLLRAPRNINKKLLEQIAQLEQKEKVQHQILYTVNQSAATPANSYAALMLAFAKQSIDGLWLTSFSMDNNSKELNISGRTIQADLVPEYISRLGNEDVLKGKSFTTLNMHLPKAEINPQHNTAKPSPTESSATIQVAATVANSAARQVVTPDFIEFSLQSSNEITASGTEQIKNGGKL